MDFFEPKKKLDAAAEPAPKKQATLDSMQDILKTGFNVSFAEFPPTLVFHFIFLTI